MEDRAKRDAWSEGMLDEAKEAAQHFAHEHERLEKGLKLLESTPNLREAFRLMNLAMSYASNGRYDAWRPFQVGFLLANLVTFFFLLVVCHCLVIVIVIFFLTNYCANQKE